MKTLLRLLVVVMALVAGLIATSALMAQSETRFTPSDSPVALWCTGEGNKTIMAYGFDKAGASYLAWRYTPGVTPVIPASTPEATPEATAVASAPAPTTLLEDGGISLKLEADGRYSVTSVQWDGKVFVMFFSGCPDPGTLDAYVIDNGTWIPFRTS